MTPAGRRWCIGCSLDDVNSKPPAVLLVDDDLDLAEVVRTTLELEGMQVFLAHDGREALRLLDRMTPDVIVTDLMMPVLDGFGLLRALEDRPKRPTIACSSLGAYLEIAREIGVTATLPKPYDLGELVELVRRAHAGSLEGAGRAKSEAGPSSERRRLQAIFDFALDRQTPQLDAFTDYVAGVFDVPICLASIVTDDRQFWTAGCGIPEVFAEARGGPRSESFCTHAVAARAALVVQDALESPLFRDNLFVREHGFRFYAGVPLQLRTGEAVGTLCVIDLCARVFDHHDLELLGLLAQCVVSEVERRDRQKRPLAPSTSYRYLDLVDPEFEIFGRAAFVSLLRIQAARWSRRRKPLSLVVVVPPQGLLERVARALERQTPKGAVARLGWSRLGWLAVGLDREEAFAKASEIAGPAAIVHATVVGGVPDAAEEALADLEQALGQAGFAEAVPLARRTRFDDLGDPVHAMLRDVAALRGGTDGGTAAHLLATARRLRRMIGDVIDFAKAVEGPIEIAPRSVDVAEISAEIARDYATSLPDGAITLSTSGDTEVTCDGEKIAQVLGDLVEDALRRGGWTLPLGIRTFAEGADVVIELRRPGPPLSSEVCAKLFDGVGPSHPLGVGLDLARRIVRAHGGEIAVRTTRDETTYAVRLPRPAA